MQKQESQIYHRNGVFSIIKNSFIIFMCLFTMHIIAVVIIDPFQIFHRSSLFEGKLSNNMREQAAGIINSFDFDSIILGTSRMENTSAREASQKLGGKFVNLSIAGSSFHERHFVLEYALKKGLKNVIYSIDPYYMPRKENARYPLRRWVFLYDDSRLNDLKIYLSKKYFFKIYKSSLLIKDVDMDRPKQWFTRTEQQFGLDKWVQRDTQPFFVRFLEKLHKLSQKESRQVNEKQLDKDKFNKFVSYISPYILEYVKKYPDTKFIFVFTPMHRFYYTYMLHMNYGYSLHRKCIEYLAEQSSIYKNMYVFAFEDMDFLDDFDNYIDDGHYHWKIDSMILDCIAQKKHMITRENVQRYLDVARIKAENFDVVALNNRLKTLMGAKSAQKRQ